jgi:peptidoglycan/xylan/chitin deacetylase (PgdA/CDA1 family)
MTKVKESIIVLKYPNITFEPIGKASKSYYITPELFEKQLLWLMDWRYNPLSGDEFKRFLFEGLDIPFKSFFLVFEGGYKNFKKYAYPILKRYKMPALIFLVVNYIGDFNRWENGKEPILAIDEISELNKTTMITFGLQSKSHKDLTKISEVELDDEITSAKYLIEEIVRYKVEYFNYPYGKTNPAICNKLEEAGFTIAFINKFEQVTSLDSFYRIPAVKMSQKDGYLSFLTKIRLLERKS